MSRKSKRRPAQKVSVPSDSRMAAMPTGSPYIPDGTFNYGFYDAVNYSTNRASRPYFATDSTATLTSWNRLRALSLARWAYINVPVVRAAVDLMARLTVGTGFTAKSHCADSGLAKSWDEYYAAQTETIGFMKGESMDELLLHVCKSADVDGDLGNVMTQDEQGAPKLQFIEAHRIKNGDVTDPRCKDGIWVDQYGRRQAFNVALPGGTKTRRIEAKDFIYQAEFNRPDELRSMTNLIHALAPLQDLYEIIAFEMQSVKKNSEYGMTIETDTPNNLPIGPNFEAIMRAMQTGSGLPSDLQNGLSPGQPSIPQQRVMFEQVFGSGGKIVALRPGEKMKSHVHERPAPALEAWAEFIIRGIAAGYGLPFEVLWNPEKIGGANTRMITALLRIRLDQRRNALVYPLLTRSRFWILSRGIMRKEVKFHPDIFKVEWNPKFLDITVDSGRESRERRANVLAGLDTFTSYFSENGSSYEQQVKVRETEIAMQCEAAAALCKTYPKLTFESALARIAMLTPNANEMRGEAELDGSNQSGKSKDKKQP